jgi:hypothetical protein
MVNSHDHGGGGARGRGETRGQKAARDDRKRFKTFTPLFDFVALEVIRVDRSAGGVELPEGSALPDAPLMGIVVAAGPDCKSGLKPGDVALASGNLMCTSFAHGGSGWLAIVQEKFLAGKADEEYKDWRPWDGPRIEKAR